MESSYACFENKSSFLLPLDNFSLQRFLGMKTICCSVTRHKRNKLQNTACAILGGYNRTGAKSLLSNILSGFVCLLSTILGPRSK